MIRKLGLNHVLSKEWEAGARKRYRSTYDDMFSLFGKRIERGMSRCSADTDQLMQEYLTKVVIDNIRFVGKQKELIFYLTRRHLGELCYHLSEEVRCWETAGEVILVYSSIFRKSDFLNEGSRSYRSAHSILKEGSKKITLSNELKTRESLDEQLSDYFPYFVDILIESRLTDSDMNGYKIN